jgi:membrane AbrB-like protein
LNTQETEDEPDSLLEIEQATIEHPSRTTIGLRTLTTIAISAAGGLLAQAIGVPAGLLMGGALATAIAALAGVKVIVPNWLRDVAFVFTGVSMGASVAHDSLSLIVQWPLSILGLIVELAIIIASTGYMLRKLFGLDKGTAYLSSFPGHLSFVMGMTATGIGDSRQITIIQVIRILMLTICVPIGTIFLPIQHFSAPTTVPVMDLQTLALVTMACAAVGYVAARFKIPAGYVLGAMATATIAKLTGLFDGSMPPALLTMTYILIGGLIGSRFSGITWPEFSRAAIGGIIATFMTVAIVTGVAYVVSLLVDMPFGQIWLGLSPGALEGMGALGIALGYDTAFIAAHHVMRLLLLTIAIPLVVVLVAPKSANTIKASN